MRNIFAAAILVTAVAPAAATTFYAVTVEELYKESSVVVSGVIQSGSKLANDCGVAYTVWIDRAFKGADTSTKAITFQGYGPMQIGGRYYLFMSKSSDELRPIMSTNSGDMNMRAKYIEKCKSLRPPYSVNIWGNGALKVTGTYSPTVKEAIVFDQIVITPPEDLPVTELKRQDRYDNDRIDTVLNADDFAQYMNRLSTGG